MKLFPLPMLSLTSHIEEESRTALYFTRRSFSVTIEANVSLNLRDV